MTDATPKLPPHILTLVDSGSADGLLYYVVPFVRGESLRDRSVDENLRRVSPGWQDARTDAWMYRVARP